MEIKQRWFSTKTVFAFGENSLKYTLENKGGGTSFSIDYGEISTDFSEVKERNAWYKEAGIFSILLSSVIGIYRYLEQGIFTGTAWLVVGAICLIIYHFSETRYTVINTGKGKLFILKNKNHSKIIEEIYSRRKKQLLCWYGDINYSNDPGNEVKKFRWLQQQGVISEDEFRKILEKLRIYHLESQYSLTDDMGKKIIN